MGRRILGILFKLQGQVLGILCLGVISWLALGAQAQQQGQEPQFRLPQGGIPNQQFNFQGNDNNNLPLLPPVFIPGRQGGDGGGAQAQQQQQQRPGFRVPFVGGDDGPFGSVTSSVTSFFNRILRFFTN